MHIEPAILKKKKNWEFFAGSTSTTGKGPLRSSLKKPKNKDTGSITSETSSKRVRYGLGAEQTSV